MTRPAEVAAALENGMNATVAWRSVRLTYNDLERAGDVMAEFIETTLARLLREREANTSNSSKGSTKPAAPAVGEDEALLTHWHDDIVPHASAISSPIVKAGNALAARLRAALSDLGRVRQENDKLNAGMAGGTYCAYCGYRVELDDMAASEVSEHIRSCPKHPMREVEAERDEARAALSAAVAKEREAWKTTIYAEAERHRLNDDPQRRDAVLWIIRARANAKEAR